MTNGDPGAFWQSGHLGYDALPSCNNLAAVSRKAELEERLLDAATFGRVDQ